MQLCCVTNMTLSCLAMQKRVDFSQHYTLYGDYEKGVGGGGGVAPLFLLFTIVKSSVFKIVTVICIAGRTSFVSFHVYNSS